jgi:hypothetical protein
MAERIWIGLDPAAADGQACVVCGRGFRVRGSVRLPVGRSQTGSQVFACAGDCAQQAAVTREVLAIPGEALTAGGVAFLAALDPHGGDLNRANPDDLVADIVGAAAPLVVAAELWRIAAQLRARAQELDPTGGER